MSFDLVLIWETLPRLVGGIGLTLLLLFTSLFGGALLAAPTVWALLRPRGPMRGVARL